MRKSAGSSRWSNRRSRVGGPSKYMRRTLRSATRRLESVLNAAGVKAAVLTTQTPPEDREAWYERQLKAGVQAFIGHPRLVQTGLDYVEYGGCRGLFFLKQVVRFSSAGQVAAFARLRT